MSANYFDVMGTRVVRGRGFVEADERPGEPVMIVSKRFAQQLFPGKDALGAMVRLGGPTGAPHRIVGIVQDAVINEIGEPGEPYFYLPYWRTAYSEATYVIDASSADVSNLSSVVRETLKRLDGRLEPRRLIAMSDYITHSASVFRATAALAAALGFVGLVLTTLGVYGVVSVPDRTTDARVRRTSGTRRRSQPGVAPRRWRRRTRGCRRAGNWHFRGPDRDAVALVAALRYWSVERAGVRRCQRDATAVCVAAYLPARRATRVSPSTALREG